MEATFQARIGTAARVVNALILREINSRFGGSRLGYLWAIITPVVSILVLYALFVTIRERETSGMPLLLFLVTGWFTYGYYQSMVSQLGAAAEANRSLLMHQNVTRLDCVTARAALETLTTVAFFIVGALIAALLEGSGWPDDMLLVTESFFAAGLFGAGLGVTMCAISTYFPVAMNFLQPFNRFGFFLSGVIFTAAMLPSWTYDFIKWNPLLHPVEGMRQGWFETYQSPILDLGYTYSIAFPLLALGLYLERRTRRGIRFG